MNKEGYTTEEWYKWIVLPGINENGQGIPLKWDDAPASAILALDEFSKSSARIPIHHD